MLRSIPPPGRSCLECRRRKIKCDRSFPCSYCVKVKIECTYPPQKAPQTATQANEADGDLLNRVERLEAGLQSLGEIVLDICELLQNGAASSALEPVGSNLPVRQGASSPQVALNENVRCQERPHLRKILTIDAYQPSSVPDGPVSTTLQADSPPQSSLSDDSRTSTTLGPLRPQPADIYLIWQKYLDNVDPLIKIFHVPTIQRRIFTASRHMENLDSPTEFLMFAICYSTAVTMSAEDCRSTFDDERADLLDRCDGIGPVFGSG
jgi:hypothetical protein